MTPARLDEMAATRARKDARRWVAPLSALLTRAKRERIPLRQLQRELRKVEFDTDALVRGQVRAQQIAIGLGIIAATRGEK